MIGRFLHRSWTITIELHGNEDVGTLAANAIECGVVGLGNCCDVSFYAKLSDPRKSSRGEAVDEDVGVHAGEVDWCTRRTWRMLTQAMNNCP